MSMPSAPRSRTRRPMAKLVELAPSSVIARSADRDQHARSRMARLEDADGLLQNASGKRILEPGSGQVEIAFVRHVGLGKAEQDGVDEARESGKRRSVAGGGGHLVPTRMISQERALWLVADRGGRECQGKAGRPCRVA